ncbi:diguanylate cyclase domain-containing protein [Blastococcus sp. LR1]|uniref:diguanylate cyclase domain-containing protein n=1 Tax=Blastococcus sp. LR1 TaxID=2877000 RepID=UPI001CC983E8|nr:diguanylate cyclase [Blastococcus sp. LR1]MCA0143974.1 diguanylate cyclase [Blastococcus sp. LR1]
MQAATDDGIEDILASGDVRGVFQPIIDLDSGQVVAYEALARGPEGSQLERPDVMFAAARAAGRLAELDAVCRSAAFCGAVDLGLLAPLTVFVNVEPEVLDYAPLDDLLAIAANAPTELRVVMEITERALAARPAELLRTVERVRELGWGIALDDVGADSMSLAFMPLLRPDVVKLDLRLVQERPGPAIAEITNAVNAYAERSGARVLAEGIETDAHLRTAKALGATLGQGWLFGRPAAGPAATYPIGALALPLPTEVLGDASASPFAALPEGTLLRRSPKSLLIELSKQLEREGMRLGETAVVAATFQEAQHFTPATAARYRDLVARTGFVCALGEDLPVEPVPGVRGAALQPEDPVRGEWDLVVLAPHFSAALLARDLGDTGPDLERTFEFALTYERETVARAARALLSRVAPRPEGAVTQPSSLGVGPTGSAPAPAGPATTEELLHRALSATTSGVTIADMRRPDAPLVFVNSAFEQLSGFRLEEVLGRNCRFLQTADTDAAAVARIRDAIARGGEIRETLLNVRGPERTPWWNEIYLAPVTDEMGAVVQYIGVQNDVTARVEAERALIEERDRARSYLTRIEQFAFTDPLTGLLNRRRLEEQAEAMLLDAQLTGSALALLFVDLNGFKAVNDHLGHAAGDDLLVTIAGRLRGRLRRGDLLARLGGDEFLVILPGLDPATAVDEAAQVADGLTAAVAEPVVLGEHRATVGASIGVSTSPADGTQFAGLLHVADVRMYEVKRSSAR